MFSLNAPIPGQVKRLASDLYPALFGFETVRDRHTLVVKRLGDRSATEFARVEAEVRRALAGAPAFEARVTRIEYFETPARGTGPVVYLAVESPGLVALHERLVAALGAAPDIEGENYVPHVTLARGGTVSSAEELAARDVEPVTWTVEELHFWDAKREERAGTVSLPA